MEQLRPGDKVKRAKRAKSEARGEWWGRAFGRLEVPSYLRTAPALSERLPLKFLAFGLYTPQPRISQRARHWPRKFDHELRPSPPVYGSNPAPFPLLFRVLTA